MAVRLVDLYPGRVEPASEFYPHGSFRNKSSPEAEDGSPLDRQWGNDVIGFLQALLAEANIKPSGSPDRVGASQYLEALKKVFPVKTSLSDAATTSVDNIRNGLIPKGARTVFYQATAPAGWVQVTTVNDRVLRVVNGLGGGSGGNWEISGLSANVTVEGHALTEAQLPSITIEWHLNSGGEVRGTTTTAARTLAALSGGDAGWSPRFGSGTEVYRTPNTKGEGHGHGASASVSQNGLWRPAYIDVIVCERR